MSDEPSRPDIVNDLALLYELSLSVGTSLHLETNCDVFLKTLQRRKDLDYSAVWLRDPYPQEGEAGYRLLYASPRVKATVPFLPVDHPMVTHLSRRAYFSEVVRDSDPFATERALNRGCIAVFALGDLGILKLHARRRTEPFDERELKQLNSVLSKFATSLEGCLAHQQLLDEIQEHHRTQREIVDLKNFYEQVLDAMPAQLAVFDADCRYMYINPAAVARPERRAWIIGKSNEEYATERGLNPAIGKKRDAALRLVARRKKVLRFEESFPGPDGRHLFFERFVSPVCDDAGNVVRILGFGLDITDRRRAVEALREGEARQRAIMQSSLDGIITFDQSSRVLEFNPAAERTFSLQSRDVVGRRLPEALIPPDLQDQFKQALAHYLDAGEDPRVEHRFETTALRADGEQFPAELAVVPSHLEDGRVFFTAYVRDITERKAAERELLKANKIAEQSIRAKDLFLANMSHEMRTPLSGIIGMTHLLGLTYPTPEQQKYLEAIKFSADTLLVLINDVLDFAKIGSGKIEFEHFPFHPRDILRGLVDTLSFQAQEKGLTLTSSLDESLPHTLLGDPVRLHQILLNLVGNAIKFTDEGEVSIRASRDPGKSDGVLLRFVVSDTGIGIPADKKEGIFDRFIQLNDESKRTYDGAGLGLAIVRDLAEGLGGQIEVHSTPGKGSTFTVVLPFPEMDDAVYRGVQNGTPHQPVAPLRGSDILVVEDNEINQFVIRNMLEKWGARVEVAGSGARALKSLRERVFHLVLMDIQMPDMDGYETARAIREDLGLKDLPVLALTASTLMEDRGKVEAAGMNDFILKPFDPDDLRARIIHHLGEPGPAPIPGADRDYQYVNLNFLKEHAFGRKDFILRMIDLFRQQMPHLLGQLQQATRDEAWSQVNFIAHKMRSSSRMLGIDELEQMLRAVEVVAVDSERIAEIQSWVDRASDLCEKALAELAEKRYQYE